MDGWEYKTLVVIARRVTDQEPEHVEELNQLGAEKWELMNISLVAESPQPLYLVYHFKRPVLAARRAGFNV